MAADGEAGAADSICRAETRLVINTACPVFESGPCAAGQVVQAVLRSGRNTQMRSALAAAQPSPSRH